MTFSWSLKSGNNIFEFWSSLLLLNKCLIVLQSARQQSLWFVGQPEPGQLTAQLWAGGAQRSQPAAPLSQKPAVYLGRGRRAGGGGWKRAAPATGARLEQRFEGLFCHPATANGGEARQQDSGKNMVKKNKKNKHEPWVFCDPPTQFWKWFRIFDIYKLVRDQLRLISSQHHDVGVNNNSTTNSSALLDCKM